MIFYKSYIVIYTSLFKPNSYLINQQLLRLRLYFANLRFEYFLDYPLVFTIIVNNTLWYDLNLIGFFERNDNLNCTLKTSWIFSVNLNLKRAQQLRGNLRLKGNKTNESRLSASGAGHWKLGCDIKRSRRLACTNRLDKLN